MEFIATQKFLIMSPRKLRDVAFLARKMKPNDSILRLAFVHKRAAEPLIKVIKSAIANAKAKGAQESELIFKEIQIGEGPRLKRGTPVSRGQWHPIKKRMSHIRVVLTAMEIKSSKVKTQNYSEKKGERQKGAKPSSEK